MRIFHSRVRDRAGVEHRLAHLANRQGPRARYLGVRKNTFDLCRLAVVQNLETIITPLQHPHVKSHMNHLTCLVL